MDMEVVRKCLEEAGLYDKNLKDSEMLSYYKAIKDSETTAFEEDQQRKDVDNTNGDDFDLLVTSSKPSTSKFTPKHWVSDKKKESDEQQSEVDTTVDSTNERKTIPIREKLNLDAKQEEFRKKLDSLHPFVFDDQFMSKSHDERADLFYQHYEEKHQLLDQLARSSLIPAPTPKIITPSQFSSSFVDKEDSDPENTYTSRSGRHTKRKNYSEDCIDSNTGLTKKTKLLDDDDDFEWHSRNNNKTSVKPSPRAPLSSVRKQDTSLSETPSSSESQTSLNTPKSKPSAKKKLTNEDIMNRSALFADKSTPVRKTILLENAKADAERKRKEEEEMAAFEKSLLMSTEETSEAQEVIQIDDEPFIKRRVEPKLPPGVKKGLARKRQKNNENQLDITIEPSSSSSSAKTPEPKNAKKVVPAKKRQPKEDIQVVKNDISDTVRCPICSKQFSTDVIAEHASACGETQEDLAVVTTYQPVPLRAKKGVTMTCEICDKVLMLDTNYEVHVNECIAQRKRDMNRV